MLSKAKQAVQAMKHTTKAPEALYPSSDFLSSGLTCLDLATYGRPGCGLVKGKMYWIVGRSSSGKTMLARTILAEAANNTNFDGYELIHDDVERGALMDTKRLFGQNLADRLMPPARGKDTKKPICSRLVSDFFRRLTERLEKGRKLIWCVDSLDCLNPDGESKMGDGKAKQFSQGLRKLVEPLEDTGSILLMTSQSKVDLRSLFGGETTSGGFSPEYYSAWSVFLRKTKSLKRKYKDKEIPIGHLVAARVKKNRLSGKDRLIYFPFYPEIGCDDVGSCVDFLIQWKHWMRSKGVGVEAVELAFTGTRDKLIQHIEKNQLEQELRNITAKVWAEVEAALSLNRKGRYQ